MDSALFTYDKIYHLVVSLIEKQIIDKTRVALQSKSTRMAIAQWLLKAFAQSFSILFIVTLLNTNTRERLALEELAACVGLSLQAMTNVINGQ
ncbi:hypothetical protein GS682_09400 [Nostoc sp. B(2019)]|nr:hypothetical protein [Nostoc sp. B(2019)]